MKKSTNYLIFTSFFTPAITFLSLGVYFAFRIYYLERENYEILYERDHVYKIAMFLHFFTTCLFSLGAFLAVFVFRKWVETIRLILLAIILSISSTFLLAVVACNSSYYWGSFGWSNFTYIFTGLATRICLGFIGTVIVIKCVQILQHKGIMAENEMQAESASQ